MSLRPFGKMEVVGRAEIGSGSLEDLEAITEIYGHYVLTSAISFDLEVPSADKRR